MSRMLEDDKPHRSYIWRERGKKEGEGRKSQLSSASRVWKLQKKGEGEQGRGGLPDKENSKKKPRLRKN